MTELYKRAIADQVHANDLKYVNANPGNEMFLPMYGGSRSRTRILPDNGSNTAPSTLAVSGHHMMTEISRMRGGAMSGGKGTKYKKRWDATNETYVDTKISSREPWLTYVTSMYKNGKRKNKAVTFKDVLQVAKKNYRADMAKGFPKHKLARDMLRKIKRLGKKPTPPKRKYTRRTEDERADAAAAKRQSAWKRKHNLAQLVTKSGYRRKARSPSGKWLPIQGPLPPDQHQAFYALRDQRRQKAREYVLKRRENMQALPEEERDRLRRERNWKARMRRQDKIHTSREHLDKLLKKQYGLKGDKKVVNKHIRFEDSV
jgi:hypothetical protein